MTRPLPAHRWPSTKIAARNPITGPSCLASLAARLTGIAPAAIRMTAAGTAATASGQPRGLLTAHAEQREQRDRLSGGVQRIPSWAIAPANQRAGRCPGRDE